MKDLFLFTIGPVKEFIDNSRKLMDLYAGSSLLSELIRDTVCRLEKEKNVKILFPHVPDAQENKPANIPNRIVAEFIGCSEEEKREIADKLTAFVKQRFGQRSLDMLKKAGIEQRGIDLAQKQWNDFVEIYWVFEAYDSSSYADTYQRMRIAMNQVKEIRPFSQTTEPWGRKCILFPKYNAIFAKRRENNGIKGYPYQVNPSYVCDITDNEYLDFMVKPNEALSSIALVKRIYGSTTTDLYSIRYMLLAQRISDTLLTAANVEGMKYGLKEMLADAVYDLDYGHSLDEEDYTLEIIQKADDLYRLIKKNGVKLSSYYAIIKFDGDNMGDAFRLPTAGEQQVLSESISHFAYEAPEIIKDFGGLPVFAGGEDFLGFIPLDDMFACVSKLRERFFATVKQSFSVGISIAHIMQPLKEVMASVDAMEASAKRMPGKNAFAISIMKRSGTHVKMPAYKLDEEKHVPQWQDLAELVQILHTADCSNSMYYNIARMLNSFLEERTKPQDDMVEVLMKQCVNHAALEDTRIDREAIAEKLMLFYKNTNSMEDFLYTLDGISFLSREVTE